MGCFAGTFVLFDCVLVVMFMIDWFGGFML